MDAAALFARHFAASILRPATWRTAEVNNDLTGFDQLLGFIDLFQLVGRTRAKALFLRELHIGIIDVIMQPLLVDAFPDHSLTLAIYS